MLSILSWFSLRKVIMIGLTVSHIAVFFVAQRLERLSWVEKEALNTEQIVKLNQETRAKELVLQKKIIEIEGKYREKVATSDSILFANGLWVNAVCQDRQSSNPSNSNESNREKTCKLSNKDAEFLIGIAKEADRNTEQLNSLIDVVTEIRK